MLIIDDERLVLSMLRLKAGYDLPEAATAETTVALYEARPADLVITDIFMPEADAMAKMLELVIRNPELKVIAVSGAASEDTAVGVTKLPGARRIIQKPFCIHELLEAVRIQVAA